jgi:hypothetical protein
MTPTFPAAADTFDMPAAARVPAGPIASSSVRNAAADLRVLIQAAPASSATPLTPGQDGDRAADERRQGAELVDERPERLDQDAQAAVAAAARLDRESLDRALQPLEVAGEVVGELRSRLAGVAGVVDRGGPLLHAGAPSV